MAPSRKSELESDPERENKTKARAPNPAGGGEDPERSTSTQAKATNPLKRPVRKLIDPEKNNATQAKVKRPERKPPREPGPDEDYKTGRSYGALDDEAIAGERERELSLEGDGLEALDPEFATRTKALADLPELDDDASVVRGQDDDDEDDDANATRAGSPVKLEIIAGPDKGKTKKFKGIRMVIGRTPGVDLLLSDQSVSRRHIELVQDEGVVSMRDLGSGNGTKVNGAKVAEKKLEHGDEISIGKTKLRFIDEVSAFKKARELAEKKELEAKARAEAEEKAAAEAEAAAAAAPPEPQPEPEPAAEPQTEAVEGEGTNASRAARRPVRTSRGAESAGPLAKFKALPPKLRLAILGLGSLVFLILFLGVLFRPAPPPPVDTNKVLADQKMQDARTAVRTADFELAVKLIEEAEKLSPGIDKTKLGNQAREELAFIQNVEEARGHITARRFEDARKALERAAKGSVKAEEIKAKVRQELETAEVVYKKEKIAEFIAAGEIEAAKATLNELPLDQQAESAAHVVDFERQLEEQKKQDEQEAQARARQNNSNRRAQREEEIAAAFTTVDRKFAGGEWDRAASECNRVIDFYASDKEIKDRARQLANDIPGFGRAYDEGMKKYRAGALAQASRPLRQAWQLYAKMKLTANKYGPELESKLGESSLAAGREALLHDDLLGAYQNFKDATRFDPNDPKARDGLVQVESKAEDLFQMAYGMKDSDPQAALRKFKIVVQVTDAQSTYHERAKNNIAAMQP